MQTDEYYLTTSKTLISIPHLDKRLGKSVVYKSKYALALNSSVLSNAKLLAWGKKPSALVPERLAKRHNKALVRLEDAFLRSVELGAHDFPLGIVIDHSGIYYDAAQPSDLESFIKEPLAESDKKRAERLIIQWRQTRVSKYNHCRSQSVDYGQPYVVLVDQTFGDASIQYGAASAESFQRMLARAKELYPNHKLIIKTHPDVIAGLKKGHFQLDELNNDSSVVLEGRNLHPADLLEHADAVFCVTSQMGFEGLLWGKPVYTFGMPFYAGWGLTHDHLEAPKRRAQATLAQLVIAALIKYARYWHPEQQKPCDVEELMTYLGQQRRWRERFPESLLVQRFPKWKKPFLTQFFQGTQLKFLPKKAQLPADKTCVVWGRTDDEQRICVEDGFVRSVGLGADLVAPKSWVIDDVGMYYDATRPSKLEQLLLGADFSSQQLKRADAVRKRLIAEQVSKYNVGTSQWQRPHSASQVVLVPGQVESDASIAFGSPKLKSNLELLQAVRKKRPSAYIIYKPHPDVHAGLRKQDSGAKLINHFCNEIVTSDSMASLLEKVDEVHTMTSLTGFEALLRNISVTCYGQPFYSGWGLTDDVWPNARRGVQRTLSELIVATLLEYPCYLSAKSKKLTVLEQVLDEIAEEKQLGVMQQANWQRTLKRCLLKLKRF